MTRFEHEVEDLQRRLHRCKHWSYTNLGHKICHFFYSLKNVYKYLVSELINANQIIFRLYDSLMWCQECRQQAVYILNPLRISDCSFNSIFPNFRKSIAFWKISRLRPFVPLVRPNIKGDECSQHWCNVTVPRGPPKISKGLVCNRPRVSAMTGPRLNAPQMAVPFKG